VNLCQLEWSCDCLSVCVDPFVSLKKVTRLNTDLRSREQRGDFKHLFFRYQSLSTVNNSK
jgi:hypothetical protein